MSIHIPFDNSYARLDERFFTKMNPTAVKAPSLIALNAPLAADLGLDADALTTPDGIAALAGNLVPDGAAPLAQVYAGHQFGGWSPRLGDGRAILLGEVVSPDGQRFDIQLKGSGPTPYSRMGDGRAWVGPVLREYIVSEAMHALGVPTTRALAAVSTGDIVLRENPLPGAILTRVASSHIRVGTFQYFASQKDTEALAALTDHALARHDPDAQGVLGLLDGVIQRQAKLIAQWMGFGFVHGVMNTDNMTVSGETIDYGPCAFLDSYHPMQVFSSIDQQGRYAYGRQPDMAMWNLAQLATSLLPLIDEVETAQASLDRFPELFRAAWIETFRAKIGLQTPTEGDGALIEDLLTRMAQGQADFTNTFRALGTDKARAEFVDPALYDAWDITWRERLAKENTTPEDRLKDLHHTNPALIARTHRIEQAIEAAVAGDFAPFERLSKALRNPFSDPGEMADLARPPTEDEVVAQTFCGT
ncbi:MAG: YdiU family protein [Boseongicola sp.]|nr:YdiU family protein [Boseongicola sp.]NNJ67292.1 YdiU family protein [Boseongicola sp.]